MIGGGILADTMHPGKSCVVDTRTDKDARV